jgi:hypothetical protein
MAQGVLEGDGGRKAGLAQTGAWGACENGRRSLRYLEIGGEEAAAVAEKLLRTL